MIIKINEEEFDINTKLGATFKIEERLKRPYLKVLSDIDDLTAKQQIDMLCCGLDKEDESKFRESVKEIGLGQLSEYLEEFVDGLQYPGLSGEEIEEKKLEKIKKQKHYKEIGLIN